MIIRGELQTLKAVSTREQLSKNFNRNTMCNDVSSAHNTDALYVYRFDHRIYASIHSLPAINIARDGTRVRRYARNFPVVLARRASFSNKTAKRIDSLVPQ